MKAAASKAKGPTAFARSYIRLASRVTVSLRLTPSRIRADTCRRMVAVSTATNGVRLAGLRERPRGKNPHLGGRSGMRGATVTVRDAPERTPDGARLDPMLHRVSLKTDPHRGRDPRGAAPAVLISAVMVPSLHDSAIQEATARYELLAQGLASEHDRFLTSHRQAVQMLTRHLEDRTEKSLGAVGMADRQVPGLRSAPALSILSRARPRARPSRRVPDHSDAGAAALIRPSRARPPAPRAQDAAASDIARFSRS